MSLPTRVNESISATATGTIALSAGIALKPHVLVGITFLDAAEAVVTPTAGTYSITGRPEGQENYLALINGTAIDATAAVQQLSYAGNINSLKYTPIGITGATSIKITITGNAS